MTALCLDRLMQYGLTPAELHAGQPIIRIAQSGPGPCNALVEEGEIAQRESESLPPVPDSHTPWEALYRQKTGPLAEGGVLDFAVDCRGISARTPRHNHEAMPHHPGLPGWCASMVRAR